MGTFLLRRAVLGAEALAERVARGRARAPAAVLDRAERAASRAAGGTGGVSGAGGLGGAGGMTGVGGTDGACVNDPDLEVIRVTMQNLRWQAASCGTLCENVMADEALFLGCVNACVEDQAPGLSSECTGCYGDLAWCAGTACNSWCANQTVNACTPDCTADSARCPGYSACLTELNQCAGRDSLDCLDDT